MKDAASARRAIRATYRLQLSPAFGFADALAITGYLARLGVSHLYLSPIFEARAGSTHGYDVVDPRRISEALGGEEGFVALATDALGVILDLVPNHMATDPANPFWSDPELRERFFDLDPLTGQHRRFFDVDDLAGVRVEDPEVFAVTHALAFALVERGLVDGLRIDHVDGLADPAGYLTRVAEECPARIFVEKILQPGESLRRWPVEGTTGYEFMNDLNALFVDPRSAERLSELAGHREDFATIGLEAKREVLETSFRPEVNRLASILDVPELEQALTALPVYRTYVNPARAEVDDADRAANTALPFALRQIMDLDSSAPEEFVLRFQQTTTPVTAKGIEDTALYRHVRLLALNEVGGDPDRFGLDVAAFHAANIERCRRFPSGLLAASTHDTKRSADVRSRLLALSSIAEEWAGAVTRWHEIGLRHRRGSAPDWHEELFFFQTLVGCWPIGADRLDPYLHKAMREAKRHTTWADPDERYEQDVLGYCHGLLADESFLSSFEPLAERVAYLGERVSLAAVAIRLCAPGVPDLYWGDETWRLSLVDPDNRRPIDWQANSAALDELEAGTAVTRQNAKLFVTERLLRLRQEMPDAFGGEYAALEAPPTTCAFGRGDHLVVAASIRAGVGVGYHPPRGEWVNLLEPLAGAYPDPPAAVYVPRSTGPLR